MKILYYECYKIWSNRKFPIFIILMLCLNIFFISLEIHQKNTTQMGYGQLFMSVSQAEEQQHKDDIKMYPKRIHTIIEESDKTLHSTLYEISNGEQGQYLKQKKKAYKIFENRIMPYKNTNAISYSITFPITRFLFFYPS